MSNPISVVASRPLAKHPLESLTFGVDFSRLLEPGELLVTPVTASAAPQTITIGQAQINTALMTDDLGIVMPPGTVVQLPVAEGVAGADYDITVVASTNRSAVRVGVCRLQVRDR